MAHTHPVYDTDKHFSIDPVTRKITNESGKLIVVQHDHNSERFTFEIPKEVDGHDMSLCNSVQIHYLNIEAANKSNKYAGIYEVDDLQTGTDDAADIVFGSWLISGNATQYVGALNFIVRFACLADDGTLEYVWNTAIYSGINIGEGIYNSDAVVTEYADVLEAWHQELFNEGAEAVVNITAAQTRAIAAINDAKAEAVEEVATSGGVTDERIEQAVSDYLAKNPVQTEGDGLTANEKTLILSLFKAAAYTADVSAKISELEALWSDEESEATLSSISATYSGGNVVAGTDVSALTGVVVTAHYSDGTSKTVYGYTLSGTIVEGENTITVSYGGLTTAFVMTGTAAAAPVEGYLYHFDGDLATSGTKSLGLAATEPTYSTDAKFGKSVHINSADAVPVVTGMSTDNIPVLDGDFTIAFWGKMEAETTGYFLFASKFDSDGVVENRLTDITAHNGYGASSNTCVKKYAGIVIFVDSGKPRVRLFSNDLTKGLNAVVSNLTASAGTWHHYALCRANGVIMFFVDGKKTFSLPLSDQMYFPDQISIGNAWTETAEAASTLSPTYRKNVLVDELIIDDATCYYSEDFTPSEAPYGS